MAKTWIDTTAIKRDLSSFFQLKRTDLSRFGQTVNQTFEAFVVVTLVRWYADRGWKVQVVNPARGNKNQKGVRLKFSTRGKPNNYTYFLCSKGRNQVQIRHQLRVATHSHDQDTVPPANICLDVAVIESIDLSEYKSDNFVPNELLRTFGEAKHMSAFAELIAGFIGLVHELRPRHLRRHRNRLLRNGKRAHLAPFLYVSGWLNRTARGMKTTIERREYDVDIYHRTESFLEAAVLPSKPAK